MGRHLMPPPFFKKGEPRLVNWEVRWRVKLMYQISTGWIFGRLKSELAVLVEKRVR